MSEQTNTPPAAEEVNRRLLVLRGVVTHALAAPTREELANLSEHWTEEARDAAIEGSVKQRDDMVAHVQKQGLWEHHTDRERAFLSTSYLNMSDGQQTDFAWRLEAAQVLMWALGFVPELPPLDELAKPANLKLVRPPEPGQPHPAPQLRSPDELQTACALADLWHWRCVTRQMIEEGHTLELTPQLEAAGLTGFDDLIRHLARGAHENGMLTELCDNDFVVNGKAYRDLDAEEWSRVGSVTVERHHALNWLCGNAPGNRWDEVPISG